MRRIYLPPMAVLAALFFLAALAAFVLLIRSAVQAGENIRRHSETHLTTWQQEPKSGSR